MGSELKSLPRSSAAPISETLVNEFRYGHQSASVDFNRPEREDGPQLSFNTFTTPILTLFAQGRNSPVNEYTDNLTKVRGHPLLSKTGRNLAAHVANGSFACPEPEF